MEKPAWRIDKKANKAQSAMEYLMTYGWAILILGIVLGSLYALGLFSPNTFRSSQCIMPANFGCLAAYMQSNGLLTLNIEQATPSSINVTAIGCNTNATYSAMESISPPELIGIGSNRTFSVLCYAGNKVFSGNPGTFYNGYILINYTDLETGFMNTVIGTIAEKVQ